MAPFEGRYRYIGYDAIYAARLAIREINARGGVGGAYLELVAYDDRAEADLARAAARNLVLDPAVVGVVGHYQPLTTQAAAERYTSDAMPWIVIGAWLSPTQASVLHMLPPADALAAALTEGPFEGDGAASGALWLSPHSFLSEMQLLSPAWFRLSTEAEAGGAPDVTYVYSDRSPDEVGALLAQWRAAGWDGSLVGGLNLGAPAFIRVAGELGESTMFITPYPLPADVPDTSAWMTDYAAMGPHVPAPGFYALPTYEAINVLAEAIARASTGGRSVDRVSVAASLVGIQRQGYLGVLSWDAEGFLPDAPLYQYRWREGTPVLEAILGIP